MTARVSVQLVVLSLVTAPILAQPKATPSGSYDRTAEVSVTGTVVGVEPYSGTDGTVSVHLVVNTGTDRVRVHVAPAMFVGQNNFYFLVDDRVSIVGAHVGGQTAVWARTITMPVTSPVSAKRNSSDTDTP